MKFYEIPEYEPRDPQLWLQDKVMRGLTWLRRSKGLTQTMLAEATGWKQPHVSRLEDFDSSLITSLEKLQRYAKACNYTGVIAFVDLDTKQIAHTIALDKEGEEIVDRLTQREVAATALKAQSSVST